MLRKTSEKSRISSSIKIRYGTPKDIPFIKKGLIESWVRHARNEPKLLDEERMRKSDVEGYYRKAFKSGKSVILVAEVNGKKAGLIKADIQTIPDFFKHNKILFIDDTYVLPKFRKKGIARLLNLEVEVEAKKRGIKRLQSRIYTFNKPMQQLRKSLDYRSPHATWDKLLE